MATQTTISNYKKQILKDGYLQLSILEKINTAQKAVNAGKVLAVDSNKNFWLQVMNAEKASQIDGSDEALEAFAEGMNISKKQLDVYLNAYLFFAGKPEVLSSELDLKIYEFATEKLASGKADLDQVIKLLQEAIHYGFTFEQFKKALNKISGSVGTSTGSGKKTQVRFVYPAYDLEQDQESYIEDMSASFFNWQSNYVKDIEKERTQKEKTETPMFNE